jgi:transcriptional antiterminator NusG
MDEHEIEEQSEQESQEPIVESTEAPEGSGVESTREAELVSETETDQPLQSEAVDESTVAEPDAEAAPALEIVEEIIVQDEVEEQEPTPVKEARSESSSFSGMRGGQFAQGEIPPEASTEPAWYVIHCYSGYENKVRHNLEQRIETMGMKDRIFDVVIPTQEEIEVREGKRRTVERHIFPGYVLVNMSLSEESWYVVRNTPGVTGFVGMGNLPTALRPEEVSQIIKRMEADAPTVKVTFKVGERVRIIDGPFNDFRGTVSEIDMERTKVRVMVSFFGRETPVELDFLQVEKA